MKRLRPRGKICTNVTVGSQVAGVRTSDRVQSKFVLLQIDVVLAQECCCHSFLAFRMQNVVVGDIAEKVQGLKIQDAIKL